MISLGVVEFLFAVLMLIAAYFIAHPFNGFMQAAVAHAMGDSTAKNEGYMSLNPFVHVDFFGLLALIFLGVGWLQTVPLDPYAIQGRWREGKLFLFYMTEALASIFLAIIALFIALAFYGADLIFKLITNLFMYYGKFFFLFSSSGAHLHIAELFSKHPSSSAVVVAFLLVSLVYLTMVIATISIIVNIFRYAMILGFERGYNYINYAEYLSLLGPILLGIVFGQTILNYLMWLTIWGAGHIGLLFGVIHG